MTDTLNGINLERVAKLVSGMFPIDATQDEHRIADAVRKYGQQIEREGYLPDLRRKAMYERVVELAQAMRDPEGARLALTAARAARGDRGPEEYVQGPEQRPAISPWECCGAPRVITHGHDLSHGYDGSECPNGGKAPAEQDGEE
jgi:ribosomal protein S21